MIQFISLHFSVHAWSLFCELWMLTKHKCLYGFQKNIACRDLASVSAPTITLFKDKLLEDI